MTPWKPTRIKWLDAPLRTSTGATRVETDAGSAVAKFMGNPEGPTALFCEWVGTLAAAWLGLPTFDIGCVDAPGSLVTYDDGSVSVAGPAFVARWQAGHPWGGQASELAVVENLEALSFLVVLDTWLRNCDRYRKRGDEERRNTRNVFLSAEGVSHRHLKLIAMDHTHVFTCGRPLTARLAQIDSVRDESLYGHFPEFAAYLQTDSVRNAAERLQGFHAKLAHEWVRSAPTEWKVNVQAPEKLSEFLADRAHFVADHVEHMLLDNGLLTRQSKVEGES